MDGWMDGWMDGGTSSSWMDDWNGSGSRDGGEVDEEEEIRRELDGMSMDLEPLLPLVQPL
jgi:hypothetical protein